MKKKFYGLSLIELLTVLGIVAILTLYALPHYTKYVVHENRMEAKSMLLRLASAMERQFLTNASYRYSDLKTLNFPEFIANDSYQLIVQSNDNYYLLIADPIGKQAERDHACGKLFLDSHRIKRVNGNAGVNVCWAP